jgi:lipopolysaccharide assembly outer membrane protein LptD (OstA)
MQICNRLHFNIARRNLLLILWLAFTFVGISQQKVTPKKRTVKNHVADSIKTSKDSASTTVPKQKPNQIDAQIVYSAQDSIVLLGNGTGFLHGESDIKYKNINLKANFVRVKMDSSTVFARGTTDSVGKKIGEPVFMEGVTEYKSKELTYNLRTKKGYIRQAVTKQGEGYVVSDKTKKTNNDILCITNGKYTTCDNHEHPDFYLDLTRGKVKTGKYIVSGPAYLVVEDVPLPIALPFGFFPFTDKYSSGIVMPTFRDEQTRGFGLMGGGYYFAINDYMDLELKGDIFTKGTWAVNALTTYVKRYKYRGSFNFSYREDVTGEKDLPNYSKSPSMSIVWSHAQDTKANPYFNFSSSVNFSTSGYNRNNIDNYYRPEVNSQSTKSSSVSFTQRFPDSPFNISGSMNVAQSTRDSMLDLSLPNLNISMSRIYPFKRKSAVGKERWYEKIAMSYSGTFANSIRTKEDKLLTSSFSKDWKNGMRHNIPVSATFNLLKYINVSPSFNYNERWYLQSINQTWDKTSQSVETDTVSGFNRVYDFNLGVSASTKLYGFYTPIRAIFGDKVDRIRHVMTPSVGFSYTPDFGASTWGYYGTYTQSIVDQLNPAVYHDQAVQYSHYASSLYGAPGVGKSGSINFALTNNVEMKLRNDKDTTGTNPFKNVSLIDNLSISGSYNTAADSMQWSLLNASLRLKVGKSQSISLNGVFDPYMYGLTSSGSPTRINKLRWENGKFPRFLGTSSSYSYTLSNETFSKKKKKKNTNSSNTASPDQQIPIKKNDPNNPTPGNNDTSKDKKPAEKDEDGYQKVTIPWSISVNYSVTYANSTFNKSKMEYDMALTHNLSASGNISLTSNWKLSTTTTYDFKANQFTYTNVNIIRNLHCWTMTASVVPFGVYKSYSFKIGVNASMLQDLKYDKQSGYGGTPITWY